MVTTTYPISVDRAKAHLRADDDDSNAIQSMLDAAQGAVLNYLKVSDISDLATGSPPVVPDRIYNAVSAAILLQLGYLYRNRDSDPDGEFDRGYLPKPVTSLLFPLRDPACA